jgi:trigger factor
MSTDTPDDKGASLQLEREERPDGTVLLTITLPPERLEEQIEQVYRHHRRHMSVPGFRKGKAPRALVERYLPREEAQQEAVEELVHKAYDEALEQARIDPLLDGELEKTEVQEGGSLLVQATVLPKPEVTLGEYKGLPVEKEEAAVAPEHVQAEIRKLREQRGHMVSVADEPAQEGDLVVLDYFLEVDGQRLERYSASDYPAVLGQDKLFPELNEAVKGAKVGDERRLAKEFPAGEDDPDIAGKKGEFVILVKDVKKRRLPEEDDDFARAVGAQSVESLRQTVEKVLRERLAADINRRMTEDVVRKAVSGSRVDLPRKAVEQRAESMMVDLRSQMEAQGMTFEQYLESRGLTESQWRLTIERRAQERLKRNLVLDAIGRQERIEVSAEDVAQQAAVEASVEGLSPAQARKALGSRATVRRLANLAYLNKVERFLMENAEETSPGGQ